jgi:hypothetical protein
MGCRCGRCTRVRGGRQGKGHHEAQHLHASLHALAIVKIPLTADLCSPPPAKSALVTKARANASLIRQLERNRQSNPYVR